MPKISRRRKGKRNTLLGKKKIINTRKFHGGTKDDSTQMTSYYTNAVKTSWFLNERKTQLDMAKYIAISRAHIENLIVN